MIEITCKPNITNKLHHDVTIYVNDRSAFYGMMTIEDMKQLCESLYGEAASLTGYIYKAEKL